MRKKLWIVSIGVVILLVLTYVPTLTSQPINKNAEGPLTNILTPRVQTGIVDITEIRVYHIRENGDFEVTVKNITSNENEEMMNKLIQTEISNLTPKEIFEEKLEILKEYGLVSSNITLEDIMDVEKLESYNSQSFNISEMEPFAAHFAPIFLGGMGFGAGFGFRGLPIIRRLAGNIFSIGVIGLGAIVCLDFFASTLYYQITFTLPLLVHVLAGFVGIMLFAFDGIFPPIPGKPPVTIYSNIVALGVAGLAVGILIPPI
jgi:hypothetical protein